mgnify:CR=1 FL=1
MNMRTAMCSRFISFVLAARFAYDKFRTARSGNVVMVFGLSMAPLLLSAGAAIRAGPVAGET